MFIDAKLLTLDEPEYRQVPAWSVSQWKSVLDEPELFHGSFIVSPPLYEFDETAYMIFGTNVHADFLEGKTLRRVPQAGHPDCPLASDGSKRGNKWKEWKASHTAIECLSAKEFTAVHGMRRSIESQPRVRNLLWGPGPTEVKIAATHATTGLAVRGMLDKIRGTETNYIIADLKASTIDPTNRRKLSQAIYERGYAEQGAAYWDLATALYGVPPLAYINIWAQSAEPYNVRAVPLAMRAIEWGRRRNEESLCDIYRRQSHGDWFGAGHDRIGDEIDLPEYVYAEKPIDYSSDFPEHQLTESEQ